MPNTVGGAVDYKKKKKKENMSLGLKGFSV